MIMSFEIERTADQTDWLTLEIGLRHHTAEADLRIINYLSEVIDLCHRYTVISQSLDPIVRVLSQENFLQRIPQFDPVIDPACPCSKTRVVFHLRYTQPV